jgi:hypothetical protein
MPRKDIRYYINTINLKVQAATYHLLDKLSFLDKMKSKEQAYFSNLYNTYFEKDIELNPLFSKEYITYRYLPSADVYAKHLLFDGQDSAQVERKLEIQNLKYTEGVAMCRSDLTPHYNPLIPAFFGLVCYNDFLINQNEKALERFWIQVKHLEKIGNSRHGLFLFFYDGGTWYAGITQALACSVFIRAYILSKEEKWKILARQALLSLLEPIENGGVFKKTPEGYEWVEEYPLSKKHPFVLNGFIFVLTTLYEYLILCENDAFFANHLRKLNETFFKTIHHFKRKEYFKYSRFHWVFQNIKYQGLMVCQFLHLYELSKNEAYNEVAQLLNKDVDWGTFFRFYDIPIPLFFKKNAK